MPLSHHLPSSDFMLLKPVFIIETTISFLYTSYKHNNNLSYIFIPPYNLAYTI